MNSNSPVVNYRGSGILFPRVYNAPFSVFVYVLTFKIHSLSNLKVCLLFSKLLPKVIDESFLIKGRF